MTKRHSAPKGFTCVGEGTTSREELVAVVLADITPKIAQYGHAIVAVGDDPAARAPGFAYTVGLLPWCSHEFIVFGLPPLSAHSILNRIAETVKAGEPLSYKQLDSRFTNLPIKFVECDSELADKFNGTARLYYQKPVPMVQLVLCDREGRFPEDPDFDHAYMDPLQPLLYRSMQ